MLFLPNPLGVGREAAIAYRDARDTVGLPNCCTTQRRKPEDITVIYIETSCMTVRMTSVCTSPLVLGSISHHTSLSVTLLFSVAVRIVLTYLWSIDLVHLQQHPSASRLDYHCQSSLDSHTFGRHHRVQATTASGLSIGPGKFVFVLTRRQGRCRLISVGSLRTATG